MGPDFAIPLIHFRIFNRSTIHTVQPINTKNSLPFPWARRSFLRLHLIQLFVPPRTIKRIRIPGNHLRILRSAAPTPEDAGYKVFPEATSRSLSRGVFGRQVTVESGQDGHAGDDDADELLGSAFLRHVSCRELFGWGTAYFIRITMMTMTVWFGLSASGIW